MPFEKLDVQDLVKEEKKKSFKFRLYFWYYRYIFEFVCLVSKRLFWLKLAITGGAKPIYVPRDEGWYDCPLCSVTVVKDRDKHYCHHCHIPLRWGKEKKQ